MARVNNYVAAPSGSGWCEVMPVKAHAALAAGAVVWIAGADEDGFETSAVASGTTDCYAAVIQSAIASGDIGLAITKGYAHATNLTSGSFTAGHGIECDGGNIEDSGGAASFSGAATDTDFAAAMESGTTVTDLDIFLFGHLFSPTT